MLIVGTLEELPPVVKEAKATVVYHLGTADPERVFRAGLVESNVVWSFPPDARPTEPEFLKAVPRALKVEGIGV